jgi:hypothetical protein
MEDTKVVDSPAPELSKSEKKELATSAKDSPQTNGKDDMNKVK